VLNICFPYGSREEITAAIRSTVEEYMTTPAPQRTMFSQSRISRGIMTRQAAALPTIRDASPAPSTTSTEGHSSPTLGPGSPSPQAKSHASDDDNTSAPLSTDNITVESLSKHMYTANDPPVDLFIRTSGVERLSDFLTWQSHQDTYIAFAKCLWPDFGLLDFVPILLEWQWWQRQREKDQAAPVAWKKA
jgi:ditrans,polycis-polyprenyl diphosphate synthase